MITIALNKLIQWSGNVRKTNADEGIEELAASIAAHGLLNPLTVRTAAKGKYDVVAGQRRLMALQALAKAGTIDKTAPVECHEVSGDADATEISLAENVVRSGMHPADQFEAWRDLVDKGSSPADIAARFGVSELIVTKRLKLGRVSPVIMALYRGGKIGLQHVEAFAVSDDHAEQERVWAAANNWTGPSDIRRALTQGEIPASDKRVRFVGLDAYEAAGGAVRRDLFDDRNAGYVADAGLLDRLVTEKLAVVADEVRAEGWKWVEVRPGFDQYGTAYHREFAAMERGKPVPFTAEEEAEVQALETELEALEEIEADDDLTEDQANRKDEIESRLEQLRDRPEAFSKAAMKRCGAVITIGYDGLEIVRGLVLKADAPKAEEVAANDEPPKSAYSQSLRDSLTKEVTGAMQAELAANPRLALIALLHGEATNYGSPVNVTFSQRGVTKGSLAERAMAEAKDGLEDGMPSQSRSQAVWAWLTAQTQERLLEILAYHVAKTLDASAWNVAPLRAAQSLDIRKWFTPNTENYFGKVSRDQIFADMAEMGVSADDLKGYAPMKKVELAKVAAGIAAERDWVPVPMRAGVVDVVEDEMEEVA